MFLFVLALLPFICSGNELEELIQEGQEGNPAILAAKYRVEQALLKHDELSEFFEPSFFALIGKADSARNVPGSTGFTSPTNDSYDAQVGFEVPVSPGAYVSLGGARRVLDNVDGHDDLYQTIYGVRVRIPLLRDRAFKAVGLNRALAMAEYNTTVSSLLKVSQILRRDIELAYITAYENLSAYRVAQDATRRFQALQDEAVELSRLKVIPEYQIFQSKLELQIGQEDEEKARVKFDLGLLNLADAVGLTRRLALAGDADALLAAAESAAILPGIQEEEACTARGAYLEIQNNILYTRVQLDMTEEERQDQLDVNFGITAQGEHETNPFGMNTIISEKKVGTELTLVWRRSIDYRGPRLRAARHRARISELNEDLRGMRLDIRTAMMTASMNHSAALKRLKIINQGIEAARQTLAAEQERFRLGESTSSNVTDAQKNLTTILQRQTAAVADLLRAKAEYLYAAGYFRPAE